MLAALDTATPAGGVALADGERILALRTFDAAREHSRRLFGELEAALADAGGTPQDIEAVAVTIGPGSFTGLRIGLSAAKGLCRGLGVPLVAVSTLQVLAARLPWCRLPVCALLDARRGEVYSAVFDTSEGPPRLLSPARALPPAELLAQLGDQGVLFTGDGVAPWADTLTALPGARLAPPPSRRPCAAALAWLAQARWAAGDTDDAAMVEPEYLRTPAFVPAGGPAPSS